MMKKSKADRLEAASPSAVGSLYRYLVTQCQGVYQNLRFNRQKRDIVVYRVECARDSLDEVKQQFNTALEKFSTLTHFQGGSLEEKYRHLKSEYDLSLAKAQALKNHIASVDEAALGLFAEWQEELQGYQSRSLRSNSQRSLKAARQHYNRLMKAMKEAENKMYPVLAAFQDQTLLLKHNLNAHAIAALENDFVAVGINIANLIGAMEKSIAEANCFLNSLVEQKALSAN